VREVQASHGGDQESADLHAGVAAVVGLIGDGDLAPGQGGKLVVQRGLVGLDDQQVGGALVGDQPVSVLTLGMERVGGDDPPSKVQPLPQWLDPGDLVGGVVDLGLGQDRTAGVSIPASRWTRGLGWWPLPRRVLPSTATACRHAA
jgi:hypothetical protein